MKITAIIPARGGSKGILKKNIKLLAGKPLIAYTIEEAKKSKKLERVIVSTEDQEIASISRKYGAEIVERPEELAHDKTPTIDVIFNVIDQLREDFDKLSIIMLLQPTSPLRTVEDIDNSIDIFTKSNCESVISVCESPHCIYWGLKIEQGLLKPLFSMDYFKRRRQDFEKTFFPNGAIFITTVNNLYKYKTFMCNNTIPYIMPTGRSIDIDNETDLKIAEFILKFYTK